MVADIKSWGLPEAVNLHSRCNDVRFADPDIKEFAGLYREVMVRSETLPTKPSAKYYIRSLEMTAGGGATLSGLYQAGASRPMYLPDDLRRSDLNIALDGRCVLTGLHAAERASDSLLSATGTENRA